MLKKVKYIILGAGPTGLSLANKLLDLGEDSFIVLEKESEAGGLCRSQVVGGSPLDIGGGHFLDVKNQNVLDFVFMFVPKDKWNSYDRTSTIRITPSTKKEIEIDYPFESNLWQFPVEDLAEYLMSIAAAGCNTGEKMPEKFPKWIVWKLGEKIAKDYMLPYNRKIWSIELDKLGTYWLYKLPNVSFKETLLSCLKRELHGSLPAHAKFFYPKEGGYGIVWKKMAERLKERLKLNTALTQLDTKNLIVNNSYQAEKVISTIPWTEYPDSSLPANIKKLIEKLEFSSVEIAYCDQNLATKAHWIYIPDESIPYHRILTRHNFCENSKGYWTETNLKRVKKKDNWNFINKYAYPLNTIDKPDTIKKILKWAEENKIIGIGRWGEWEHMNSDVAVQRAINLAQQLHKE